MVYKSQTGTEKSPLFGAIFEIFLLLMVLLNHLSRHFVHLLF
jgi:hypothetical protein